MMESASVINKLDQQQKQYTDASDIDKLLEIAVARGVKVAGSDVAWVPESMVAAARRRVKSYVVSGSSSPSTARNWRALGIAP